MGGRGLRFVIICLVVVCVALLAMRLSRMREPSLQAEIAAQQAVPAEMFYIGSKYGKIYHNPSCSQAVRLSTDELITFTSARQARRKGYRPCETCRP